MAMIVKLLSSFFITEPAPITLTVTTTDETMVGANDGTATAAASGGTGGFTYDWTNGETTSSISDLEPGEYTLTVTDMSGLYGDGNYRNRSL